MQKLISITWLVVLFACDSTNENIKAIELQACNDLESNRKVIAEFSNEEGTINAPEEGCPVYTIEGGPDHPERNLRLLAPCNLPENFEEDDLKIVFSGNLYETFETEDICAQAFELTEITFK